jgi:hypothetical protein
MQKLYAKLLGQNGYGYPLFQPNSSQYIKVGDVGYFEGTQFVRVINAFTLDEQVLFFQESLKSFVVASYGHEHTTAVRARGRPNRCSRKPGGDANILCWLQCQDRSPHYWKRHRIGRVLFHILVNNVDRSAAIKIHISRMFQNDATAVCIPTQPVSVLRARDLHHLLSWWATWNHNIFLKTIGINKSLFLVYCVKTTHQYAICCNRSAAKETEVNIHGSVPLPLGAPLQIQAGADVRMLEENGAFGFHVGHYRATDPWVVFFDRHRITLLGPFRKFKKILAHLFQ